MAGTPSPISLRAAGIAAAALVALLVAGVLAFGLGGGRPAVAQAASGGCTTGPFAYDAAETRRQAAFETRIGEGAELPAWGFHATAPDITATLHAASHSAIVVFYRPGTDTAALRALADDAVAQQIPFVAVPREQRRALVAITQNVRLTCDTTRVDTLREFAAPYYAGLAAS